MSIKNLEKTLLKELDVLNEVIDRKIIKGLSYKKESIRHKFILRTLKNIKETSKKSFGFFNMFSLTAFK
jgi:hypothetical protein